MSKVGSFAQVLGFFSEKSVIESLEYLKSLDHASFYNGFSSGLDKSNPFCLELDNFKTAKNFSSAKRKTMALLAFSVFLLGASIGTFATFFVFSRVPIKALLKPYNVVFFTAIPVSILAFVFTCIFAHAVVKHRNCSTKFREMVDLCDAKQSSKDYIHKDSVKLKSSINTLSVSMFFVGLCSALLMYSLMKNDFSTHKAFTGVGNIVFNAPIAIILLVSLIAVLVLSVRIEYYQKKSHEDKLLFDKNFSDSRSLSDMCKERLNDEKKINEYDDKNKFDKPEAPSLNNPEASSLNNLESKVSYPDLSNSK